MINKVEYEAAKDAFCGYRNIVRDGFDSGFKYALETFSIWRNGTQTIGCLDTPIKDVFKECGIEDTE